MWWLAAVPVIWGVKLIYDAVTKEDTPPPSRQSPSRQKSALELNLDRLRGQLQSHSGRKIAILGQPGAGKSSLLINMTKGKVAPPPVIGTHTDATNWACDSNCNLLSHFENYAFADVPGYDTASHPANVFASSFPFDQFDAFIFVIQGKLHSSDESIFRLVARSEKRFFVTRSFSEDLEHSEKKAIESEFRNRLGLQDSTPILFFSNRTKVGVSAVFKAIRSKTTH